MFRRDAAQLFDGCPHLLNRDAIPPLAQIPVKLALAAVSRGNAPLIDQNTGEPAEFYSLNDVALEVGIFDPSGFPLDLSNLAFLSIDLLDSPTCADILATVTIPATAIEDLITTQNWEASLDQNASLSFGAAQLAGLNFCGRTNRWFWMVIHGITSTGEDNVYGAGWVRIYNAGVKTLNLPLTPTPTVIPKGTTWTIPAGVVVTTATPIANFGTIVLGTDPAGLLPPGRLVIT